MVMCRCGTSRRHHAGCGFSGDMFCSCCLLSFGWCQHAYGSFLAVSRMRRGWCGYRGSGTTVQLTWLVYRQKSDSLGIRHLAESFAVHFLDWHLPHGHSQWHPSLLSFLRLPVYCCRKYARNMHPCRSYTCTPVDSLCGSTAPCWKVRGRFRWCNTVWCKAYPLLILHYTEFVLFVRLF